MNIDQALTLAKEIDVLEAQLRAKRTQLSEALSSEGRAAKTKTSKPKSPTRAVNVSATVLAFLQKLGPNNGTTVPTILERLHLREQEAAVRSSLKKHAMAGRVLNDRGMWTVPPLPLDAPGGVPARVGEDPMKVEWAKEKAPEVSPEGQLQITMFPPGSLPDEI